MTQASVAKLAEVSSEVSAVVERASQIVVENDQEAQAATAFLAEIKAAKTRSERARTFLVGPLNQQVRKINAMFKEQAEPLDRADKLVREKVLAFRQAQEREWEREQARLDAERKAAEEQAAAVRRRAWEEAQRAQRAAEEAAAQAREAASAEDTELERHMETLDDEVLHSLVRGGDDRERPVAKRLLESRLAERVAAAKLCEAEEATQASIAVRAAPAPTAPVAAPLGAASVRKEWKATIVDSSRLPRFFLMPDTKAINEAVRAGERHIPGVRIEQVAGLAVRGVEA
jgi:translation initiation factor 3 subunit A